MSVCVCVYVSVCVCVLGKRGRFGDSDPTSVHNASPFVFPFLMCLEGKMSKANQLQNPGEGQWVTAVAEALLSIAQRVEGNLLSLGLPSQGGGTGGNRPNTAWSEGGRWSGEKGCHSGSQSIAPEDCAERSSEAPDTPLIHTALPWGHDNLYRKGQGSAVFVKMRD